MVEEDVRTSDFDLRCEKKKERLCGRTVSAYTASIASLYSEVRGVNDIAQSLISVSLGN